MSTTRSGPIEPNAKILVTPRSVTRDGHPALARLEQADFQLVMPTPGEQPDESVLLEVIPDCVGYLAGVEPVSARVLEAATQLRCICRNGTGVNSIDIESATRLGIEVKAATGANARGVAELAIGLMLSLVRAIPYADSQMKSGAWQRRIGMELEGRTLGLVGCGNVGRHVVKMAAGMGMRVLAYDPYSDSDPTEWAAVDFRYASLDEVLAAADVISLHCPANPNEPPLIDANRIEAMKSGVYLINTARGELLDDVAILAALDGGKISGLAIDAFRSEPPGSDPLVLHELVIATPHVGAFTAESVDRAVECAVDNLIAALTTSTS